MTRLTADWTAAGLGAPVVLRLAGHLDVASVPVLHDALSRCLVDEPDLVVLDFSAVTDATGGGAKALPALADRACAWPGASMVLAGLSRDITLAVNGTAAGASLSVYPDVFTALARADGGRTAGPRIRLPLQPTSSAAATARKMMDEACGQWGVAPLRDTARLIVTELVSNAVRHAATALEVGLACADDAVHISVRDYSRTMPHRGEPVPPTVEGGRGLLVVDLMSRAWGTTPTHDGKVVWASLATPFLA